MIQHVKQEPSAAAADLPPWRPPGASAGENQGNTWDGWVRFLRVPATRPPWFPTGLVPRLARICQKMQIDFEIDDHRVRPEPGEPWSAPIPLRPEYQGPACDALVKAGRGVLDLPPRAGKTRILAEAIRRLGLPTVWIAPTRAIVGQTVRVLQELYGNPELVVQLMNRADAEMVAGRMVVCMTASMASYLPVEWFRTRSVMVVDEVHHAAAIKTYQTGFLDKGQHVFHTLAATGTFFRSGEDVLALHAAFSEVVYSMSPKVLMDMGFLVPTRVVFLPIQSRMRSKGGNNTFMQSHGKYGIHENKTRNGWAARAAWLLARKGRRVLVMVGTKKQGRLLLDELRRYVALVPGSRLQPVEFVSSDDPSSRQDAIVKAFLESDVVRILIGTSLLGEGVDLPTADAMVYAKGEKAEVSLVQNAYRVGTAIPGKREAIIVDFADRHHKNLVEHGMERLRVYHHEPTFEVEFLDRPDAIDAWVDARDAWDASLSQAL